MRRWNFRKTLLTCMMSVFVISSFVAEVSAGASTRSGTWRRKASVSVSTWAECGECSRSDRGRFASASCQTLCALPFCPIGFAYAAAGAGPYFSYTVRYRTGRASAGVEDVEPEAALSAEPELSVPDSFNLVVANVSANQIQIALDGSATIRASEIALDSHPQTILTLKIFPDSTSANPVAQGDCNFDLAGNVTFSGLFNASHFIVSVTPDSVKVTAQPGASLIITVPDTGLATPELSLDDEHEFQLGNPPAVPGVNGVGLGVLAALMSFAGFLRLRRARIKAA